MAGYEGVEFIQTIQRFTLQRPLARTDLSVALCQHALFDFKPSGIIQRFTDVMSSFQKAVNSFDFIRGQRSKIVPSQLRFTCKQDTHDNLSEDSMDNRSNGPNLVLVVIKLYKEVFSKCSPNSSK